MSGTIQVIRQYAELIKNDINLETKAMNNNVAANRYKDIKCFDETRSSAHLIVVDSFYLRLIYLLWNICYVCTIEI